MFEKLLFNRKYAFIGSGVAKTTLYRFVHWKQIKHKGTIPRVIGKYCEGALTGQEMKRYMERIKRAYIRYGWDASDYFAYHYDTLSHKERQQFVGEYEKHWFAFRVNSLRSAEIYFQKWSTYQHFEKYYKRDIIKVMSKVNLPAFELFVRNHPIFILKPFDSTMGLGIHNVNVGEYESSDYALDALLKENPDGFLAEELIVQDPEIAKIHPQSVNTLRVHTFRLRDGILVYKPYLRIGRGNSVVDNAGAGGIFTSVNEETGAIEKAVDEFCHEYTEHPDTGFPLIGYRIPRWEEAKSLARELATVIEDSSYVGWDLALTEKGWVMIEGNFEAQFVFQMPYQEGFRKDFEEIKRRIKTQR